MLRLTSLRAICAVAGTVLATGLLAFCQAPHVHPIVHHTFVAMTRLEKLNFVKQHGLKPMIAEPPATSKVTLTVRQPWDSPSGVSLNFTGCNVFPNQGNAELLPNTMCFLSWDYATTKGFFVAINVGNDTKSPITVQVESFSTKTGATPTLTTTTVVPAAAAIPVPFAVLDGTSEVTVVIVGGTPQAYLNIDSITVEPI